MQENRWNRKNRKYLVTNRKKIENRDKSGSPVYIYNSSITPLEIINAIAEFYYFHGHFDSMLDSSIKPINSNVMNYLTLKNWSPNNKIWINIKKQLV